MQTYQSVKGDLVLIQPCIVYHVDNNNRNQCIGVDSDTSRARLYHISITIYASFIYSLENIVCKDLVILLKNI